MTPVAQYNILTLPSLIKVNMLTATEWHINLAAMWLWHTAFGISGKCPLFCIEFEKPIFWFC